MFGITSALMGIFILSNLTVPVAVTNQTASQAIKAPAYSVAMTGYNAVPEQTDADPSVTASGAYSNPDIVVARSIDLADELPFGTVIEIDPSSATSSPTCGLGLVQNKVGLRVVADSMHPRKRKQIDILFDTDSQVYRGGNVLNAANILGMCKDIKIRIVGRVDIKQMPKNQAELKRVLSESPLALKKW